MSQFQAKIKTLNLSASWEYNFPQMNENVCGICRCNLMAKSVDEYDNNTFLIPILAIGKCGHVFHNHCILNFHKKHVSCPTCTTTWKLDKLINESKSIKTVQPPPKKIWQTAK